MSILMSWEQLVIKRKGFALIEVLLSSSLFLIIVIFSVTSYLYGQEAAALSGKRNRALLYASNDLEALYDLRDNNFNNLPTGGPYHLSTTTGSWQISSGSISSNGFTRSIFIEEIDTNRLKASSTVIWKQNEQREGKIELSLLLSNWQRFVSNTGNWANPNLESVYNFSQQKNGNDVATSGDYAYVITSNVNPNFFIFNISGVMPILESSLSLDKDLNRIIVSGDFAYIGGDDNKNEIQILDISDKNNPSLVSSYNTNGNGDVYGLFLSGDYLYFSSYLGKGKKDQELFILDVSNPNNPSLVSSIDLEDTLSDIKVIGNYLYASSYDDNRELQIFDISNPLNITRISSLDLAGVNGDSNGLALEVLESGDYTFVSRENGYINIIDTSSKNTPNLVTGTSIFASNISTDLQIFNNENYLAVANSEIDKELKIYDISDIQSIAELSVFDLEGIDVEFLPTSLSYNGDHDKIILTGESDNQLQIVIPGP